MASKLQAYAQMADHAAHQITGSYQEWTAFLSTAGRLYKISVPRAAPDSRPAAQRHRLRGI